MNIYVANSWFFAFSFLLIAIFILFKRQDAVARHWFYFSIFVTIWATHYALLTDNGISDEVAMFAVRYGNASAAFIPATWLYFICGFLNIKRHKIFWLAWSVACVVAISAPTELLITAMSPVKRFRHYPEAGPVFYLFTLYFFTVTNYGFYLLLKFYFVEKDQERKKEVLFLMIATAFGFIGGGSSFSLVYLRERGIDLTLLMCAYPFLMAYAMIKHRAFDIEKIADAFQKEKLAAIGILAASVNHELKNPLFVARATLETGVRKLQMGSLTGEAVNSLFIQSSEKVLAQIDRAVEIMQRLTDFAKPADGEEKKEKVVVGELFGKVLELVNSQFTFNKINLVKEIEEGLIISGNKRQLEEILFNLILNACQAMPQGGNLFLSAKRNDEKVRIEIRDSGSGIPSADQDRIFEPFYSTKGQEGTGLGLYVTRQLVERNKGKISVESRPSQGTTFTLEFSFPK